MQTFCHAIVDAAAVQPHWQKAYPKGIQSMFQIPAEEFAGMS